MSSVLVLHYPSRGHVAEIAQARRRGRSTSSAV